MQGGSRRRNLGLVIVIMLPIMRIPPVNNKDTACQVVLRRVRFDNLTQSEQVMSVYVLTAKLLLNSGSL